MNGSTRSIEVSVPINVQDRKTHDRLEVSDPMNHSNSSADESSVKPRRTNLSQLIRNRQKSDHCISSIYLLLLLLGFGGGVVVLSQIVFEFCFIKFFVCSLFSGVRFLG